MPDLTRRELLSAVTALAWAADARASQHAESALKDIQKRIGGRLGVHVLDSQSGRRFGLDENSHYAMASTFKVALAAALLWQVDRKAFTLDNRIHIDKSQLLLNSPAVEVKLMTSADAMTVRELLAAAVTQSDNAATNILLRSMGGPSAVTEFFRTLGDNVSRLDREKSVPSPAARFDWKMPAALTGKYQYFTQADMSKLKAAGWAQQPLSLEDGVHHYIASFLSKPDPYR